MGMATIIGLRTQDIYLNDTSIAENSSQKEYIKQEQVEKRAQMANIHDFIAICLAHEQLLVNVELDYQEVNARELVLLELYIITLSFVLMKQPVL